ncbi:isopenicillin N synthase family dioxygenase [Sulfitobacter donghicola]|uniref:2-oxoglutarate-dependent ethylene/succinate-forming enzyme n=1 Tax=Sulfitobacter donghicola DSW-25 = KCTC 12864 = JCM 14565 TaxID=1300350 RepID=A0A073IL89_9RHOB|nr:2-oxoglutarate and iron-dependent oxygenase domain-containing protein [Sulfitobacter donghicola]KEJ90276.1 oxidoreductase [Sulfitobacter donghicola DSW-25 = KCTC 12864 = JCM 14565]KIN66553.1 2OG-Fe(II) oxygenase [Sulfitobacter donghicola DSW-25 = KCTC 12864 = JCM 14565]
MIPSIDLQALRASDPAAVEAMHDAATGVGFATVHNTALSGARVKEVIECYRSFFKLPEAEKQAYNMANTGSNRGWGAAGSEQVDPDANPDYKQYFDSGVSLPADNPLREMSVYAPNVWPQNPPAFKSIISSYYNEARGVAMSVLRGVAQSIGAPRDAFDEGFETPMALLRGNYYPSRPDWAGAKDFGIATHTDYGCLTLLATDGSPGLEVRKRGGGWIPISAEPGTFVINFGEMMEVWTDGRVRATPHRVVGGLNERISVPLFFNPSHDTNVGPMGTDQVVLAGEHLAARYEETYVHLNKK